MEPVAFTAWDLRPELQEALVGHGFTTPTPVQQEAFPHVMGGQDLLVQSRTGTGKTLAFGLPILQRLAPGKGKVEALVVLPTRELALQVAGALAKLAQPLGIGVAALFGGGSYRDQNHALGHARIAVGTPGRLCDHLERGSLDLAHCTTLVLDEADEILDMGFAEELDKILAALPKERQSLLFSATMSPETAALAKKTLNQPRTLSVSSGLTAAPEIKHRAYEVFREHQGDALTNVLHVERPELALVFCHTKAETESLAERLRGEGFEAACLNGDMAQAERTRALNAFRRRQTRLLVATDVAARGIDVKGVTHVFNLGVPFDPEAYVHRVGRTGRAGASGTAITFVAPRDGSRFRRMLQSMGVNVETRPLPQAEDVRAKAREACHERLVAKVAHGSDERLRTLAAELLAYVDPTDLVAALLDGDTTARAALEAGFDVMQPRPRPAPVVTKSVPRAARPEGEDAARGTTEAEGPLGGGRRRLSEYHEPGMSRIHLNQGKVHQLAAGQLVQLVCSTSGIRSDAIGAIALHPYFTFFDVRESEAARVADLLSGLSRKGRPLKASLVS